MVKKNSVYGKWSKVVVAALSLAVVTPSFVNAQQVASKKASLWYFGDKAGLDFSSGRATALTNGVLQSFEGSAVAADVSGRLLFYSNGGSTPYQGAIWNRNHQMMPNGNLTGAGGCNSSVQSSLILPLPGSNSKHYLFTTDCMENGAVGGLRYNVIDMNLDGGLGDVAAKGVKLTNSVDESLTAIQHDNGQDWWVVSHKLNTDSFYVYHLTASGVTGLVKSKIGHSSPDYAGVLTATSSGDKLVHAGLSYTSLFDFDKATGKITNHVDLGVPGYTAAFSSNCRMLYVADGEGKNIVQFDIRETNVPATKVTVGATSATGVGSMQLAPDGRIYFARFVSSDMLGVIDQPNRKGTNCGLVDRGISLAGKIGKGGLPNFPNSYLGECATSPKISDLTITQTSTIKIKVQSIVGNGAVITWNPTPNPFGTNVMYREKGAKTWNIEETGDNTVMLPNINLNADYEVVVLPKQNLDNDYITITEHLVDDIAPDKDDVFSVGKSKIETVSFRNKADFTIAPNPANNIVTVDLKNIDSTVKTYIRVTDLSGVEHYNKLVNAESTTQQIDVNNLKDGMYFISTLTEDENGKKVVETKKMLVSH
jgi:hypothetical protein